MQTVVMISRVFLWLTAASENRGELAMIYGQQGKIDSLK